MGKPNEVNEAVGSLGCRASAFGGMCSFWDSSLGTNSGATQSLYWVRLGENP